MRGFVSLCRGVFFSVRRPAPRGFVKGFFPHARNTPMSNVVCPSNRVSASGRGSEQTLHQKDAPRGRARMPATTGKKRR